MPTCDICEETLRESQSLTCRECGGGFCRDHYHSHECDGRDVGADVEQPATDGTPVTDTIAGLGYTLGLLLGALGLGYFVTNIDLVLEGSSGVDAIQALVSLGVAGAFFSFGTFVLVGSHIIHRH